MLSFFKILPQPLYKRVCIVLCQIRVHSEIVIPAGFFPRKISIVVHINAGFIKL